MTKAKSRQTQERKSVEEILLGKYGKKLIKSASEWLGFDCFSLPFTLSCERRVQGRSKNSYDRIARTIQMMLERDDGTAVFNPSEIQLLQDKIPNSIAVDWLLEITGDDTNADQAKNS